MSGDAFGSNALGKVVATVATVQPKPGGLVFVDCETTGLDAYRHAIWEVALDVDGTEYEWMIALTDMEIAAADPISLEIGGFHRRHMQGNVATADVIGPRSATAVAAEVAELTHGRSLIGAVPSFDEKRLGLLLRAHGYSPGWHYRPICVETLAVGWTIGRYGLNEPAEAQACSIPWKGDEVSRCVGVEPTEFAKHTALGDVRWARAMYEAMMP